MLDRSSPPDASPRRASDEIADLVVALRRQTKHGPVRIADALDRFHGITLADRPDLLQRLPDRLRQCPEPLPASHEQLLIEDFLEPTS